MTPNDTNSGEMEHDLKIQPNAKTHAKDFEISCYGEEMIMVEHPTLSAPRPMGPTEDSDFWDLSDEGRLLKILEFVEDGVDWKHSGTAALQHLFDDVDALRERYDETDT